MDSPTVKNCELKFKNTREKITLELSFQKLNEKVDIRDFFCDALKQVASLRVELSKGEYIVTDANQTTEEKTYGIIKRLPEILQLFQNFCRIPVKAFDGQTSKSEGKVDGSSVTSEADAAAAVAEKLEVKQKTQVKNVEADPENKSASEKLSKDDNAVCKEKNTETDETKQSKVYPRPGNTEKDINRDDQQSKSSEHRLRLDQPNASKLPVKENAEKIEDYSNSGSNETTDSAEKHKDKLQLSDQDNKNERQECHGCSKHSKSSYLSDGSKGTSSRDSSPSSGRASTKTVEPELMNRNEPESDVKKTTGSKYSTPIRAPSALVVSGDQEDLKSAGKGSAHNRASSGGSSPAPLSHAPEKNVEPQTTDINDSALDAKKTTGSEHSTSIHAPSAPTVSGDQDLKIAGRSSANNRTSSRGSSPAPSHAPVETVEPQSTDRNDSVSLVKKTPGSEHSTSIHAPTASGAQEDSKNDGRGSAVEVENKAKQSLKSENKDHSENTLAGIDAGKSEDNEGLRTQNPSKGLDTKCEKRDTGKYHGEYRNPKPECGSDDD